MPLDLAIHEHALPYVEQLVERRIEDIDLVVVHCTELPDLATARSYGERILYADTGTGASGHYYIDRDGRIERHVPPTRAANHTRGYNPRSVGIELVNSGRHPDWMDSRRQAMSEPYPEAQVAALLGLLAMLRNELPNLRWIAGHEQLDTALVQASDDPSLQVHRKRAPGPRFPWPQVLAQSRLEPLP